MKLEPTPEQVDAVARSIAGDTAWEHGFNRDTYRSVAATAWNVIAPMVLEAAAKLCEVVTSERSEDPHESNDFYAGFYDAQESCADAIRTLKGDSK